MSKEASKLLKKKLSHENPKVVFMALLVIELAMQKCGNPFHVQIGTKEFMNSMVLLLHQKDLLPQVKNKSLTLIQTWGKKFEREHDILPLFFDVYQALKKKGIEFPGEAAV
jgi:growth factor-regulated tyrosine kinase substrate